MAKNDLHSVAFPKFTAEQVAALGTCSLTKARQFRDGEKLFEAGQRDAKFYVIKSGQVAIVDESGDRPQRVVVHEPGGFTGDVNQITGSPAIVTGVAQGTVEAYELSQDALRQMLNHHPDLGDLILQAFIARRQLLRESGKFTGLRVIGSRYSQDTFRIRDFLSKNRVLYTWLDLEDDESVAAIVKQFGLTEADTPVVVCGQMKFRRNPSNRELADCLGLRQTLDETVYDLIVVGAGPAGLAAAVYGASEGLNTILLDGVGPGGQAGRSMKIENYLGFPIGIRGSELVDAALVQVGKFGARLSVPSPVVKLTFDQVYPMLHLDDGETVTTKCLLIATGAEYRRLGVDRCEEFEGRGVYYAATPIEAQMCRGAEVIVAGGGNSAGQAAVFLAGQVRKVYVVIRGDDLYHSMSSYLARRIEGTENIEVLKNTEIRRMTGDGHLSAVEIDNKATGESRTLQIPALFSFIGALPRTDWLPPEIERDAKGFVRTGPSLADSSHWSLGRTPFLLETSKAGVFAAGDVRSGSVKRVASAVGEGSMAVQFVHEYMKTM
jgi:thioredoxin reductase (NADPH)